MTDIFAGLGWLQIIGLVLLGLLYIAAGINHFINPRFYLPLIPHFLQLRPTINWVVGVVEIVLGVLVFIPAARPWAAWGIVLLLIAIFPAHLYDLWGSSRGLGSGAPTWLLWLRLPIQALLIAWAWLYTR